MAGLASRPAQQRRGPGGRAPSPPSGHDACEDGCSQQPSSEDPVECGRASPAPRHQNSAPLTLWAPEPYGALIWLVPTAAALISLYAAIVACIGHDPLMAAWTEWVLSTPSPNTCANCTIVDAGLLHLSMR